MYNTSLISKKNNKHYAYVNNIIIHRSISYFTLVVKYLSKIMNLLELKKK